MDIFLSEEKVLCHIFIANANFVLWHFQIGIFLGMGYYSQQKISKMCIAAACSDGLVCPLLSAALQQDSLSITVCNHERWIAMLVHCVLGDLFVPALHTQQLWGCQHLFIMQSVVASQHPCVLVFLEPVCPACIKHVKYGQICSDAVGPALCVLLGRKMSGGVFWMQPMALSSRS